MAKKEVVGLSLQDLNQYTAHQAHQADVSARKKSIAASNDAKQVPQSNAEKVEELGEGDGF